MFRITYQVRTFLPMMQMGYEQWLKCLQIAMPIVQRYRMVLDCVAKGKTLGWEQDKDFQQWVADEELKLERDGKHKKAMALRDPQNAAEVLKGYAGWLKTTLPGACFQASDFAVSTGTKKYNRGKRGRWREMRYAYLSGLVVIDVDHCGNPREVFARIQQEHDLKAEGILLVYVSAGGEGLKIVFKARLDWGNLIA